MDDLERLLATEAIRDLKARRDRAVDIKDWATREALHAPDHRSHNDGFPAWNSAAEMIAATSAALDGVVSVHHSHTPRITFDDETHASGVWGMEDNLFWRQDGEEHWLRGFGFYHERYERRDGEWQFTFRRLERLTVLHSPGAKFTPRSAAPE